MPLGAERIRPGDAAEVVPVERPAPVFRRVEGQLALGGRRSDPEPVLERPRTPRGRRSRHAREVGDQLEPVVHGTGRSRPKRLRHADLDEHGVDAAGVGQLGGGAEPVERAPGEELELGPAGRIESVGGLDPGLVPPVQEPDRLSRHLDLCE